MNYRLATWIVVVIAGALVVPAGALADPTVDALRMSGTITGGLLPTSSSQFQTMVGQISSGDYFGAATTATNTPYFAQYLARRMAKEMQNVTLQSANVPDNDATTFLVAHLLYGTTATNTGVNSGISGIWSDNVTCLLNIGTPTAPNNIHAMALSTTPAAGTFNWSTSIVCNPGQTDHQIQNAQTPNPIPSTSVGGYMTLNSSGNDQSFAQNAFTAGTNLRGVEYIYEISMGLSLLEMTFADGESPEMVPPFVPEGDANFTIGQGQPACISCHGGGVSSIIHGYATVADIFDFNENGLSFITTPSTGSRKSLGSTQGNRNNVFNCIKNHAYPVGPPAFTTCNPDSGGTTNPDGTGGIIANQTWDLSSWQQGGLLNTMGWSSKAPTAGTGLNSLGAAVGQAALVYQFMTTRVIGEICPTGPGPSASTQAAIAATAQQQDSFAYIVASVAADPNCR